jgi:hypothetical protein
MIENNSFQYPRMSPDGDRSNIFPPFLRSHVSPGDGGENTGNSDSTPCMEQGFICNVALSDELIEQLRRDGEQTEVQHHDDVPLTPVATPTSAPASTPTPVSAPAPAQPGTDSQQPHKKKNKNDANDHQILVNRLRKPPHVVEFKGAILDRNERLKIIAAVAMCESGRDPFGAENTDQEFAGRKNGHKGIETSYSRIVHIGLSYGIIQFTQDGGALGGALRRCNEKNHQKFVDTFGNNWQELLALTSSGISVPGVDYASGLDHWHAISKTKDGGELSRLASKNALPVDREIRGKRVQPIAVEIGGAKQDLWVGTWKQRFTDASQVVDFQEAQLIYAVENYLNPTLSFCKDNNIRSGLGIAFAVACYVRGVSTQLLTDAAKKKGLKVPFESESDEKAAVVSISKGEVKQYQVTRKGKTKTLNVAGEEITRAKRLNQDETGFLAEDMYWTDTFDDAHDR